MDLYSGLFAFSQATFPILTALPIIVLDFKPPIKMRQVMGFYFVLLLYYVVLAILGLLGVFVSSDLLAAKIIIAGGYILLVLLSAQLSINIAQWTVQEQASRISGWADELSKKDLAYNLSRQDATRQRNQPKVTSRQNGRKKK